MSLRTTIGHPYASVEIATETGGLALVQDLAISSKNFDGDILNISINRDMGQDCPTFSLSVVYRRDWYNMIGSNDLIVIKLHRPPEDQKTVMVGLVDDIRKNVDISSGKPIRSFIVSGRNLNKSILNFDIGAIKEANMDGIPIMDGMHDIFYQKPPATIINDVVDYYMSKGINYQFANGESLLSYFEVMPINSNEVCWDHQNFVSYQGGLWEFLKEIKNAPFNEMYWEVLDEKETLVIRPTPFDHDSWEGLRINVIYDYDIISESLGRSDLETYVVFKVDAEESEESITNTALFPIWHQPYYPKYGIKRLEVHSKYTTENPLEICRAKQEQLFNWNIKNNVMENGTLKVKGSNVYMVGTRVFIDATSLEYYVEGVQHTFTLYEGWTTTLSLTRGLSPDDRFSSPVGQGREMTFSDINNIMGYDIGKATSTLQNAGANSTQAGGDYTGATTVVPNTGNPRIDIVNVANGEMGITEKNGAQTKYGGSRSAAWCAFFAGWCINQAKGSKDPHFSSRCATWWDNAKTAGRTVNNSGGNLPKPGDVIFFNKNGTGRSSHHVGIVERVDSDGTIHTIEGNAGSNTDRVAKSSYKYGYKGKNGRHIIGWIPQ